MCEDPNRVSLLVKRLMAALARESLFNGQVTTCTYDNRDRLVNYNDELKARRSCKPTTDHQRRSQPRSRRHRGETRFKRD